MHIFCSRKALLADDQVLVQPQIDSQLRRKSPSERGDSISAAAKPRLPRVLPRRGVQALLARMQPAHRAAKQEARGGASTSLGLSSPAAVQRGAERLGTSAVEAARTRGADVIARLQARQEEVARREQVDGYTYGRRRSMPGF